MQYPRPESPAGYWYPPEHIALDSLLIAAVAYLVVDNTTLTIPLKNIVDTKKEIEKLQIKKQKEINNFNKLDNKLKNSSFIDKAPEEVIEKFKKQSSDIKSSIEKIDQIIDTIK